MKRLLCAVITVVAIASSVAAEVEFATFYAMGNVFSIQAPKNWKKDDKARSLAVASPDGAVTITAAPYKKYNESLKQFAKNRFSSIDPYFKSVGRTQSIREGLFQEFEGVRPRDNKSIYRVISISEVGGRYVSLTISTDRKNFEENRRMYVKIMESVNSGS